MGPDFELDDAQEAIVRLAGEVLSDNADTPERLWKSLGQAGLLGLAVPGELGGAGLGTMATGVLLTEIGRHAARVPAWSTLSLGVLPVARWGSPEQQRELLPAVLEGRVLTGALGEPGTGSDRIGGTWNAVPYADRAYRILVPTTRGVALAGALRMTAGHVRDRHQFGRPLATFQAVAQQIADVYVASRTMHLASLAACWEVENGEAEADVWTAAYWLSSEALPALRTCHHLHGGLGLDASYPLHRHTALVRDLVRHLGGAERCLDRLGAECSST